MAVIVIDIALSSIRSMGGMLLMTGASLTGVI